MSITPRNAAPAGLVCTGLVCFALGWRAVGLVLVLTPLVAGTAVLLWFAVPALRRHPG